MRPLDEIRRKLFDVELRQQTALPLIPRPHDAPRGRRLLAWVLSWRLDEALASGADPDGNPLLAARAEQLLAPANRRRLAGSLREAVERAAIPAAPSAAVPLAARAVRANSGPLLALAARLDSEHPVRASGVARAHLLVTDGGSELYAPGKGLPLQGAVEAALIGLGS